MLLATLPAALLFISDDADESDVEEADSGVEFDDDDDDDEDKEDADFDSYSCSIVFCCCC